MFTLFSVIHKTLGVFDNFEYISSTAFLLWPFDAKMLLKTFTQNGGMKQNVGGVEYFIRGVREIPGGFNPPPPNPNIHFLGFSKLYITVKTDFVTALKQK